MQKKKIKYKISNCVNVKMKFLGPRVEITVIPTTSTSLSAGSRRGIPFSRTTRKVYSVYEVNDLSFWGA